MFISDFFYLSRKLIINIFSQMFSNIIHARVCCCVSQTSLFHCTVQMNFFDFFFFIFGRRLIRFPEKMYERGKERESRVSVESR